MKKLILFQKLRAYLDDLEELLPSDVEEFLAHKSHHYSISMLMLNIVTCCMDIGSEIISLKQLTVPATYKDIFRTMEKEGIISSSLSRKMRDLVGLRNILAHEYGEVNLEILYEKAKEVDFIDEYIEKTVSCF